MINAMEYSYYCTCTHNILYTQILFTRTTSFIKISDKFCIVSVQCMNCGNPNNFFVLARLSQRHISPHRQREFLRWIPNHRPVRARTGCELSAHRRAQPA
eukprot:458293_1